MADPFVAEIRIFPFDFAPRNWAVCNGQLMAISQNTALFSLLGTNFGGNGKSTFALPDLQGRAPMQPGQGPGLSNHDLGEEGGEPTVTLLQDQMPQHLHPMAANPFVATLTVPSPARALARASPGQAYAAGANLSPANRTSLAAEAVGSQGGDQPHNNMMPYLVANFCIALSGVFPPRG